MCNKQNPTIPTCNKKILPIPLWLRDQSSEPDIKGKMGFSACYYYVSVLAKKLLGTKKIGPVPCRIGKNFHR